MSRIQFLLCIWLCHPTCLVLCIHTFLFVYTKTMVASSLKKLIFAGGRACHLKPLLQLPDYCCSMSSCYFFVLYLVHLQACYCIIFLCLIKELTQTSQNVNSSQVPRSTVFLHFLDSSLILQYVRCCCVFTLNSKIKMQFIFVRYVALHFLVMYVLLYYSHTNCNLTCWLPLAFSIICQSFYVIFTYHSRACSSFFPMNNK